MTTSTECLSLEASQRMNSPQPVVFPRIMEELLRLKTPTLLLDEQLLVDGLDEGLLSEPEPEFGFLGTEMAQYFDDYEFERWMPGAWPVALDGAGGFYCLDLRGVLNGTEPNDGSVPVVWSHAGNLGWNADEAGVCGKNLAEFLERSQACPVDD